MNTSEIAVHVFNKLAHEYQKKFMDVNLYGETFDFFCSHLHKQHAEILELACGPGNITKYLLQKRPDFKILGTDLAPNMLSLATSNNPAASFQLLDCRNINSLSKKYDGIMCGFCLPYLSKEETIALIENAYSLLYDDGVLYISTMEDEYEKSGYRKGSTGDEIYMHFYKGDFLIQQLTGCNFKIIDLKRIQYPEQNNSITTDLIIIAKK